MIILLQRIVLIHHCGLEGIGEGFSWLTRMFCLISQLYSCWKSASGIIKHRGCTQMLGATFSGPKLIKFKELGQLNVLKYLVEQTQAQNSQ